MADRLCSVGMDVGTTTTQLIVSELTVENQAGSFAVPQMEITGRKILYQSPIHFTPLADEQHVDTQGLRQLIKEEYAKAGVQAAQVDTGAVIITGETSRKENARRALHALSGFAGDFVVAVAGPDLESALAAAGAGAVAYSRDQGKRVLHMDIGGGTSNLALIEEGKVVQTGCLNVGGRLIKYDPRGRITYISPVLEGLTRLRIGSVVTREQLEELAEVLVQGLEMAAGLRPLTPLWDQLVTREAVNTRPIAPGAVICFSGGVADCIEKELPPERFGDMGPVLGKAIGRSRLCQGAYRLGQQTIRATVIGAGCHSAMLSGSTVFCRGIALPVKNLPVAALEEEEQYDSQAIARKLEQFEEEMVVLAMPGPERPDYRSVEKLAQAIARGCGSRPILVCLEADMAKALGHCLCLRLPSRQPCLCIDRVHLGKQTYLDVGQPVGPALPVVVKTLILSQ